MSEAALWFILATLAIYLIGVAALDYAERLGP
jgi:hypothetical protein